MARRLCVLECVNGPLKGRGLARIESLLAAALRRPRAFLRRTDVHPLRQLAEPG